MPSPEDARWEWFKSTYHNDFEGGLATLAAQCKNGSLEEQANACYLMREFSCSKTISREAIVDTGVLPELNRFLNPNFGSKALLLDVVWLLLNIGIFLLLLL